MPQAFGVWLANLYVSAVAAAGGIASVGVASAIAWVGSTIATLAITAALSAASISLMGKPKTPGMPSRRYVTRDTTLTRTIVYGEVLTSGNLVFINTCGGWNEFIDFCIVISGHEIDAITDVWFDDTLIPNAEIDEGSAAGGYVSGDGDYGPYKGKSYAAIEKFTGTDDQGPSPILTDPDVTPNVLNRYTGDQVGGFGVFRPNEWNTDHRLRGCAYVHIRLERNQAVFPYGAPNNFRFRVRGAKIYDPRLDSTNGGSGTHRLSDTSTWAYSTNPALIAADYLIGGTITNAGARVNQRGFGANPSDVDWPSVIAAANICDELVAVPDGTQKRYEASGVLGGATCSENLESILTSMMGQVVYAGGKYYIYAGAFQTPTLSLNESNLAGNVEYVTGTARSDRYNAVQATRWDNDTGQEMEVYPRLSPEYEAEDGNTRLTRDVQFPFTTDEYRAQRMAQLILRRSREQKTLVWRGNLSCLAVGVWDTVYVSLSELGISNKVFRCISRDVQPQGDDHIVLLTLREEFAETYADPILEDYGDLTPANPDPTPGDQLAAPTGLTATSRIGGIEFTITPDEGDGTDVVFELYQHTAATPWSLSTLVWTGSATKFVLPTTDAVTRYYWVRARRNSSVSATYPPVSGITAYGDLTTASRLTPDAEFTAGAFGNGGWKNATRATYFPTGGVVGGYARLAVDQFGGAEFISWNGKFGGDIVVGTWEVKVTVRYRVTEALVSESSPEEKLLTVTLFKAWTGGSAITWYVTEDVQHIDMSAAVLNEWNTETVTLAWTSDGEPDSEGRKPYMRLGLALEPFYSGLVDGTVDIDYCLAQRTLT